MARSSTGESVVTRVARVLEAFDVGHRRLSVAELAARTGLPIGSAHRIVAQLVQTGLLQRGDEREIFLGIRLVELAALAPIGPPERAAVVPVLAALAAETGRHVVLMSLDDRDVIVVEHVAGAGATSATGLRVGLRVPAHAVAGGLVLLSHLPAAARERALRGPLVRYTPRTPTLDTLNDQLALVRKQGWAVADGMVDPAVSAVAVPVRGSGQAGQGGAVVAAIAVIGTGRPGLLLPLVRRLQADAAKVALPQSAVGSPRLPVRHLAPR